MPSIYCIPCQISPTQNERDRIPRNPRHKARSYGGCGASGGQAAAAARRAGRRLRPVGRAAAAARRGGCGESSEWRLDCFDLFNGLAIQSLPTGSVGQLRGAVACRASGSCASAAAW
jgi:hypothetical protein